MVEPNPCSHAARNGRTWDRTRERSQLTACRGYKKEASSPRAFLGRARYCRRMQLRRDAKLELLKGVPLFAKCSKAELRLISILADEVQFDENRTLIREGTRGREFFVLVDGVLRVTRNGRQVSVLSAGDFVGELALVTDVPRTATVTASTPVHLLVLTHRGFLDLLEQSPSIAVKVLQSLGERLHSDASSTRSVTL